MSNERKNEKLTRNSTILKMDKYSYEVSKSICKISHKNELATGFFFKLYIDEKLLLCLMTNEHVLTKDMIGKNEIIDINYDWENYSLKIKLDKKERFIEYNKDMDITLIEITSDDKIDEKYFLVPNTDNINYIGKRIFILQYPNGEGLSISKGTIKNINNQNKYELTYDASIESGSSGSPIFLKGTTKVIGIHKQGAKKKEENYGTLIKPFIESLQSKKENLKMKNIFFENDKKIIFKSGNYYKGQFFNSQMHGKGIIYYKNGNIKYVGEFANNRLEGMGKYIYENGDYYIGKFVNNKRHGEGKLYYKNGKIMYDGEFIEGRIEGDGKCFF